jgi:phospholipid/cholesterol/gamma-HCH transport system substrate-binding protein
VFVMSLQSIPHREFAAFIAAVLVAAGLFILVRPAGSMTVHADFAQVDGMFVGSNVAVLGVPLGRVDGIEPRGDHVRLTLSLPADTDLPANAEAWVMSPNVVSDQYIELTPPYRSGEKLDDGAVIPPERTRAPIKWDRLTESVNELLVAFGPEGANSDGSVGRLLTNFADMLDGRGGDIRRAILNISQATEVAVGEMDHVEELLTSLDALVEVLADNKSTVDSLTSSVDQVAGELARQEGDLADAITSLGRVLDEVAALARDHGDSITGTVGRLADVSAHLARHQGEVAEILDTFPLAADNITRAIERDKLQVRMDFSTNLSQTERGRQLCERIALPICEGPGIGNPIELPPDSLLGLLGGE